MAAGRSCAPRYMNINSSDLSNKGKSTATSFYGLPDNTLGILQLPADGVFSYISSSELYLLARSLIFLLASLLSCPEDLRVLIIYCLVYFLYFALLLVYFGVGFFCFCFWFFKIVSLFCLLCIWKPIDILHFHSSQGQEISMSALKQEKIAF